MQEHLNARSNGNVKSMRLRSVSASYNADNQLTAWGSASLSYDANGNMTSDGTNSYTWNARNKLASMNSSSISFQYDPYGRRVAKTVAGFTTNYLYDGANIVQEQSSGSPIANLLSGGIDEVFTRTDSTGTANLLTDGLNSTIHLSSSSGSSLAQYTYDPFGNTTVTSGSSANESQYAGRENDGTGLYFNRARYYNPQLGRFISEDPLGFSGGDVNLYAYTGNSPTNFVDPSGKSNSLIHLAETYLGAQDAGLGFRDSVSLATLAVVSDFFDGSQHLDAGDTNIHAMAGQFDNGQYQNSDQAYQGTADAVNTFAGVGDVYGDALAVHAIADSYSGSHNYKPDTSTWTGAFPSHFFPDLGYHEDARNAIRDYLSDRMHGRQCDSRKYLNPAPRQYNVMRLF